MKKALIVSLLLFAALFATPLDAVDSDHPVNFYVNFGIITDDSFKFDPFFWYGGVNLDFHITDTLMLSPEGNLVMQDFKFKNFWLEPAALLNVKLDHFFVGGGIGKWFLISGEEFVGSSDFFLKLNAGFSGDGGLRLRIFLTTPFDDLFGEGLSIGAQLGLGI